MTIRDYPLTLVCDGKALLPHTLQFDAEVLHRHARERGEPVSTLLVRRIREALATQYIVVTPDHELGVIAKDILERGANRTHPLVVQRLPPGADAEIQRQLQDLQNRLSNCQATVLHERSTVRAERDRLSREHATTQKSLNDAEVAQRALADQVEVRDRELHALRNDLSQLRARAGELENVVRERDQLNQRVERSLDNLREAREGGDLARRQLAEAYAEREALRAQLLETQKLLETEQRWAGELDQLCADAFEFLLKQELADSPHLSERLRASVAAYRARHVYGRNL